MKNLKSFAKFNESNQEKSKEILKIEQALAEFQDIEVSEKDGIITVSQSYGIEADDLDLERDIYVSKDCVFESPTSIKTVVDAFHKEVDGWKYESSEITEVSNFEEALEICIEFYEEDQPWQGEEIKSDLESFLSPEEDEDDEEYGDNDEEYDDEEED